MAVCGFVVDYSVRDMGLMEGLVMPLPLLEDLSADDYLLGEKHAVPRRSVIGSGENVTFYRL